MHNPVWCSGDSAEIRAQLRHGQWSSDNFFPSVFLIFRMQVIPAFSLSKGCLSHTHFPSNPYPHPQQALCKLLSTTLVVFSWAKPNTVFIAPLDWAFLNTCPTVFFCPLQPYSGSPSSKRDLVIWLFCLLSSSDEWGPKGLAMPTWFLVCTSLCRPSEHLHMLFLKHSEGWICFWVTGSEMCNQVLVLESILGAWWGGNYSDFWRHLLKAQLCH